LGRNRSGRDSLDCIDEQQAKGEANCAGAGPKRGSSHVETSVSGLQFYGTGGCGGAALNASFFSYSGPNGGGTVEVFSDRVEFTPHAAKA
jgi:hypothetical protein